MPPNRSIPIADLLCASSASCKQRVDCELFEIHGLLEAVLITQSGKSGDKLEGIITRWDFIHIST
jgi:hypothetical protein